MCEYCDNTGKIETDNNGPIVDCPLCEDKTLALAESVIESQKNDVRTNDEKIADGVAFILDTRIGGT